MMPDYRIWQDFVKQLPLSLRVLDLQEHYPFTQETTILLPRKLSALSLANRFSSILYLPKTLESLSLIGSFELLGKGLAGLPPSLTLIKIVDLIGIDRGVLDALPRWLLHLSLPQAANGFSINDINSRFPYLQTLELPRLGPTDDVLPSAFVPSLTRLSLGDWPATKPFFDLMPRSLNWLQLGTTSAVDINLGEFLPPKLQFLHFPDNDSITPSHRLTFPKSLLICSFKILSPETST
jgi:hypothetical protein